VKSGSLNVLETLGHVKACNGIFLEMCRLCMLTADMNILTWFRAGFL
jgi:hypothetical protein